MNPEKNTHEFQKSLGLIDSTSIVIGSMIGSGIFIVSSEMSRNLGAPGWLIIAWVITGIMTIIAALSYGELASMFPKAGGQYVYLREAYNPFTGFLYGWTMFTVIQTGTIAAVAMAFSKFIGVFIPWFSKDTILLDIGFLQINSLQMLAIIQIFVLTMINMGGLKFGKIIQNSFTFTKLAALFGFIIIGWLFVKNSNASVQNQTYFWDAVRINTDGSVTSLRGMALIAGLGVAMVGSIFSADAWNNITFAGAEVKNSRRNLPLALFIGTSVVIVLYILTNFIYLKVLPLRGLSDGATVMERGIQFAKEDRLGTAAMSVIFGDIAVYIMAAFIIISTFGCNNGLILSGARVFYAMSNDRLFFAKVRKLNVKNVPGNSLLFQGIWASLLCLSGTYSQLLDYVVFAVLIFYVLTILGIFILRKKQPNLERKYKAFGYPVLPGIYLLAAIFIIVDLLIYKTDLSLRGIVLVLIGIPVYFIWKWVEK